MTSRNRFFASILLASILFFTFGNSANLSTFLDEYAEAKPVFCQHPPPPKATPIAVTFPKSFSVAIEAVYHHMTDAKVRLSDVIENIDSNINLSSIWRNEEGQAYQYIFNQASKTYAFVNNGTHTCTDNLPFRPTFSSVTGAQDDPLLFPNNVTEGWLNNISSIQDIWAWAISNQTEIYKDDNSDRSHEHGIPIDHYYVCKQAPNGFMFEIEICVTQKDVKMPFANMNGPVPVRIDVKRFVNKATANSTDIEEFIGYRLSSYKVDYCHEEAFLPPPGVPCANVTSQSSRTPMPEIPDNFSVHIDYLDSTARRIDTSRLTVDTKAHFLAFEYTYNDTDIPLAAHADLPKGEYRIVHDFAAGIEYIVDANGDGCMGVKDIPLNAADAVYHEGAKRGIDMKNVSEILGVHLENATFYYVGERRLDNDLPADVWLAYKEETATSGGQTRTRTHVHEVYFSKPDWKIYSDYSSTKNSTLLALKVYVWPDPADTTTPLLKSYQRFHDLSTSSKAQDIQWKLYDVTPCLRISRNDSFLVAKSNDTMTNMTNAGRGRVENAMRSQIAKVAGVSPLRVTNFYFETVNDTFWTFFFIAERQSANGTPSDYHVPSISVNDARENLNKTLTKNLMPVLVPLADDGGYYVVGLNGLTYVPPFFTTPTVIKVVGAGGYSGSSMAALGICMLLIGGVLGMVLAFFMWKRNRAGGGTPVYFSNKSSA